MLNNSRLHNNLEKYKKNKPLEVTDYLAMLLILKYTNIVNLIKYLSYGRLSVTDQGIAFSILYLNIVFIKPKR
jgi:hypothetical protein